MAKLFKWLAVFLLAFILVIAFVWYQFPGFREKVYLVSLFAPLAPTRFQSHALHELDNYPGKTTVVALILFVNLKHEPAVSRIDVVKKFEKRKLSLTPQQIDQRFRQAVRERNTDIELAVTALKTLSKLTGVTFIDPGLYSKDRLYWITLDDGEWKKIISDLNSWAMSTYGKEIFRSVGPKPAITVK